MIVKIGAFQSNGKGTYTVAAGTTDAYINFSWPMPLADAQTLYAEPRVVQSSTHHYLLYATATAEDTSMPVVGMGTHGPAYRLITGWAPGGTPFYMPEGVGMEVAPGGARFFTIEMHLNNPGATQQTDDGVELCLVSGARKRPKNAGIVWLGTDIIFGANQVCGDCAVAKEATIIGYSPHMHTHGTRMRTSLMPKGGTTWQVLHDHSFNWQQQVGYAATPIVKVAPGDLLKTTCFWDSPVLFGPATTSEMCYNFTLHYPSGALDGGTGLVGASGQCLGAAGCAMNDGI